MKFLVLIVVALASVSLFAEKQPFERYQSIVDRQMFGPLPPDFDPNKSPNEVQKSSSREEKELTQEQEKLQSSIHFSVINVTPDGKTAVGFTDNSDPKAPVHYYLKVGEKRNGWEVKEADPNEATMTIAKGDIEVSLSLGGNSAKDGGTAKAGGTAAVQPTTASGGAAGVHRPGGLLGGRGGLFGSSLRERRMKRQQEAQAELAKAQAAQAEKDAEREAQRQAQAEQEKQQREAERAEQRQQLLAIQEELKRVREAKATEKAESSGEGHAENAAQ